MNEFSDYHPAKIKRPYGVYTRLWYGGYRWRRYGLARRLLNLWLWRTFETYL